MTDLSAEPSGVEYAIGIDVGVTNIKTAIVTAKGQVLDRLTRDTCADQPNWPERVRNIVESVASQRGAARVVGLAAPGIAAPDGSCIAWMQGRLDAVQELDWTRLLAHPKRVPVLNDAQAALLGETWIGAARGCRDVMLLTLGTGVGGALMVDGRLLRGHLGRAGHLGHVSLDPDGPLDIANTPGSLEDAIGNCTVAARSAGRFHSTHDLIAAHLAGDAEATRIWMRSLRCLAAAIASLVNVADPEIVVIGGGIARAGTALFAPLAQEMDRFEWRPNDRRVRIVPAQLGEFAGAIGAARNALDAQHEMGDA